MKKENTLEILKTEKELAMRKLEDKITSVKRSLNNLELMIKNDNQCLFASEGLQGNTIDIDIYLNQVITFNRAIELLEEQDQ
ncbi:hypothetical protein [Bacillus altitudinis]|uniref:hypothetical protein n=1 Tax=Bacillus altitudinis TaxID=293387 RepID=UPI0020CFF38B|nr:hypothetical protein [Bacillus altitudinis]